jgi:hypothetical protein
LDNWNSPPGNKNESSSLEEKLFEKRKSSVTAVE